MEMLARYKHAVDDVKLWGDTVGGAYVYATPKTKCLGSIAVNTVAVDYELFGDIPATGGPPPAEVPGLAHAEQLHFVLDGQATRFLSGEPLAPIDVRQFFSRNVVGDRVFDDCGVPYPTPSPEPAWTPCPNNGLRGAGGSCMFVPVPTYTAAPTASKARATATTTMVAPTQPPKLREPTLTITKTSGAEFFIHASGFRPSEKLTVKMTTYDGGVCVSSEPDPSCFWERQADSTGTYDRTTPLDVVTTKGKHWYWIAGAQSGATNRVVVDIAPVATSTSVSVTPTSVSRTISSSVGTLNLSPAHSTPADTSSLSMSGGSMCADGTHSPSTGSGACSHHGGIAGGTSSSGVGTPRAD